MMIFRNAIDDARGARPTAQPIEGPIKGPIGAAAAFACLLGLAACGGGGGGGSAGGPGPGSGPVDQGYRFAQSAAQAESINDVIVDYFPDLSDQTFASGRRGKSPSEHYSIHVLSSELATDEEAPQVRVGPPGGTNPTTLTPKHLGGNAYRFDDTFTIGSANYAGVIFVFWDSTPLGGEADGEHYWGVWLRQDTATDSWDNVDTFNFYDSGANSSHPENTGGDLAAHEGEASYTGAANGVYTKDGTSAGWFSADASLMVKFGGDDIPDSQKWTMTGTIDNFVLSGKQTNSWSVTLNGGPELPDDTTGAPTTRDFYGSATGNGEFAARFYGGDPAATTPTLPTLTIGEFKARFSDGRVIGTFSAENDAN